MCGQNLNDCWSWGVEKAFNNLRFFTVILFCISVYITAEEYNPSGYHSTIFFPTVKYTIEKDAVVLKSPFSVFVKKRGLSNNAATAEERRAKHALFRKRLTVLSQKLRQFVSEKISTIDVTKPLKKHGKKLFFSGIVLVFGFALIRYYRQRHESRRFMTTTRLSIMDKEVQRTCRYIEDNYNDQELGLSKICRALVTGEAFLEALFKKELGLTTGEFIDQVRINRAKIQLHKSPDQNSAVLARSIGYSEEEAFLSSFQRITGVDFSLYCSSLKNGARR